MKNTLRQGLAKKAVLFAFLIGAVMPSAMAYVDGGYPIGTAPAGQVAAVAPSVQNLNVTTATGSANVSFSLNTNATTTVWIKDATDTIVRTLAFDNNLSGSTPYSYNWNGTDNNGAAVATGNYKAQVVAYNTVSSDIESFNFNFTANGGGTVTAPAVSVSVNPGSFDPTAGQSTTVSYTLSTQASLSVLVKLNGSVIRTLRAQSLQNAGSYSLVWDGRNDGGTVMAPNNFVVEVYANNTAGSDTKTATVTIVNNGGGITAPNLTNVYATPTPFDPNTQNTSVYFTLDKAATVNVNIMNGSTTVRNLVTGASLSAGTYFYQWNGRDSSGNIVANATYTAQVTATNTAGTDTATTNVQVLTNGGGTTAPDLTNVYASPTPFNPNTQSTTINLTLDKAATVSVDIMNGSTVIRNIVSGASLAAGTTSYQWNGRDSSGNIVANATYTVRVTATNTAGTDTATTNVQVDTNSGGTSCNMITSNFVNPSSFDPDNQSTLITYNLSRTATVTVRIKNGSSTVRTLLSSVTQNSGQQTVSWNGRDSSGNMLSNRTYTYEITATASGCTDNIQTGSVTLTDGNGGYENDWPSTNEDLIKNVVVLNEVFDPRDGERSTVKFDLTNRARLIVQVLDGNRVVKTLRDSTSQSAGNYSYSWDGRDNNGNIMRDAVYTYRIMADDGNDTDTDRALTEVDTDGIIIGFPDNNRCAGFVDVSVNSPFCKAIILMSTKNIFQGYPDGTFRPYEPINRAETAKVVVLALGYEVNLGGFYGRQYSDTIAGAWYAPYLDVARKNNIATGYPDGSFRPGSTINRVELLRVFLEANHLSLTTCSPQPYEDTPITPDTNWYMKYACYAKHNGLMGGYGNMLFPAQAMTRGDVANLFYDFEQKGLYSNYNNTACNNNSAYGCTNYLNTYGSNPNGNQTCMAYDVYGNCNQYSNNYNNNSNQTCIQRNSAGTCTQWEYDDTYYTGNNSNSSDGYYVYQNGRYVWVAY